MAAVMMLFALLGHSGWKGELLLLSCEQHWHLERLMPRDGVCHFNLSEYQRNLQYAQVVLVFSITYNTYI